MAQIAKRLPPSSIEANSSVWLSYLRVVDFRIHDELSLSLPSLAPVILTGENGAGKTSLLEAVSLLGPGRGMRAARSNQLKRKTSQKHLWGVAARLMSSQHIEHKISIACKIADSSSARHVRMDGRHVSALELSRHLSLFWLTPAMARLFGEGTQRSMRRRFIDRIVMGLVPDHARHLAAFERARRARQAVLDQDSKGGEWLNALEAQMAEHAMPITTARAAALNRLNQQMRDLAPKAFPDGQINMTGVFERDFLSQDGQKLYQEALMQHRARDKKLGRAAIGPHQVEMIFIDNQSGLSVEQSSSGEVKALLTGLILAAAQLSQQERGAYPIILLDEIAAHLDETRRLALFQKLAEWPAQIWMTGTDRDIFSPMKMSAHFFDVQPGKALP